MTLRFGPFRLDSATRQVLRGSGAVHLTPKAFDLLHLLTSEAPRVLGKRELHDRLWPGTFVSDASLSGLVKELRRALDDRNSEVPVIRTVHRVGYACGLEVDAATPHPSAWHWLVLRDRRVVLREGENIVGRQPGSAVWLEASGISRRHARIVIDQAGVRLEDLGSKNGTTVDGERVRTPVVLSDGDRVAFASVAGVYRTSSAGMSTETRSRSGTGRGATPTD
jgi:DNA-binding winged helix-turn-helix (wHTH) protein